MLRHNYRSVIIWHHKKNSYFFFLTSSLLMVFGFLFVSVIFIPNKIYMKLKIKKSPRKKNMATKMFKKKL